MPVHVCGCVCGMQVDRPKSGRRGVDQVGRENLPRNVVGLIMKGFKGKKSSYHLSSPMAQTCVNCVRRTKITKRNSIWMRKEYPERLSKETNKDWTDLGGN